MAETSQDRRSRVVTKAYRESCDELLSAWNLLSEIEPRRDQGAVARVLYGFALVAVSSADASFILVDRGRSTDAFPLTRRALEFGVTSQWILQKGDAGIRAMEAKTEFLAKKTLENIVAAGWAVPDDLVEAVSNPATTPPDGAAFGRFNQICASFEGQGHLYVLYSRLSAWCHPSVTTGLQLFDQLDPTGATAKSQPSEAELARTATHTNLMALLFAMRAADERTKNKPLKGRIQRVARRHKLDSVLKPAA